MLILDLMVVGLVYQRHLAEGLEKLLLNVFPTFFGTVQEGNFNRTLFLPLTECFSSENSVDKSENLILADIMQEIRLVLDQWLKQHAHELLAVLLHHQLIPELPIVELPLRGLLR